MPPIPFFCCLNSPLCREGPVRGRDFRVQAGRSQPLWLRVPGWDCVLSYIGTIGDDLRGQIQRESLDGTGVDISDVIVREGCPNQTAYILIDQRTGERTVLWQRPTACGLRRKTFGRRNRGRQAPASGWLRYGACAKAASIAGRAGVPVSTDVDTSTRISKQSLKTSIIWLLSSVWPGQMDRRKRPICRTRSDTAGIRYESCRHDAWRVRLHGARGWEVRLFPAFSVHCADTTGAGDAFHGGFCFAMLEGMPMRQALDFSNAAAALNCTAIGARGHIGSQS